MREVAITVIPTKTIMKNVKIAEERVNALLRFVCIYEYCHSKNTLTNLSLSGHFVFQVLLHSFV